jgi:hypothetical protein
MIRLVADVRVRHFWVIAFTPAYPQERQGSLFFSDRVLMDHVTLIV